MPQACCSTLGDSKDGSKTKSVGWDLNLRDASVSVSQGTLCTVTMTMISAAYYAAIVVVAIAVVPVEQSEAVHGADRISLSAYFYVQNVLPKDCSGASLQLGDAK